MLTENKVNEIKIGQLVKVCFFRETRNEESLTVMSTVLEEVRRQCSVQTGEEYIFELIIHTKKSEYEQLVDLCPDY